jgi:hypothetical protein
MQVSKSITMSVVSARRFLCTSCIEALDLSKHENLQQLQASFDFLVTLQRHNLVPFEENSKLLGTAATEELLKNLQDGLSKAADESK